MFNFLKQRRRDRIINNSTIPANAWQQAFEQLPLLDHLAADDKTRLRDLATVLLYEKDFVGAKGFEITEQMCLLIALQACLPILNLGMDWYSGWTSIVIYPAGFAPVREVRDESGLVHTVRDELIGEAWQHGPVILSWDDTENAGIRDGTNVVIHEFVHKLDMLNGSADGFPPMHSNDEARSWTEAFTAAYEDFQVHPKPGLNRYGATAPAEFLAVLSEVFFEKPRLLNDAYPEVYRALREFFRQDPLAAS